MILIFNQIWPVCAILPRVIVKNCLVSLTSVASTIKAAEAQRDYQKSTSSAKTRKEPGSRKLKQNFLPEKRINATVISLNLIR